MSENKNFHSAEIGTLFTAFQSVLRKIENPERTKKNPFHKSTYAPLEEVLGVVKAAMEDSGLAYTQITRVDENGFAILRTMLVHLESEQWLVSEYPLLKSGSDPQKLAAAVTYGRRSSLKALFNLAEEDDDGNTAAGLANRKDKKTKPAPKAAKSTPKTPSGQSAPKTATQPKAASANGSNPADFIVPIGSSAGQLLGSLDVKALQFYARMNTDSNPELIAFKEAAAALVAQTQSA